MAGSWQAAKRAVESHFTDKCRVTEFTEEETSWGETRFSAVQGKEVTCRLVVSKFVYSVFLHFNSPPTQ